MVKYYVAYTGLSQRCALQMMDAVLEMIAGPQRYCLGVGLEVQMEKKDSFKECTESRMSMLDL